MHDSQLIQAIFYYITRFVNINIHWIVIYVAFVEVCNVQFWNLLTLEYVGKKWSQKILNRKYKL